MVFYKPIEATIGFAQQSWTVSEDAGEAVLLVESDGLNVEPLSLMYTFMNGSGSAEGIFP